MGVFNRHYFTDDSGASLEHRAKYGTANSTSSDKGSDNKKNNTSEYNHKYYEEDKEKWEDNEKKSTKSHNDAQYYDKDGKARFGHKDYDPNDPDFKRTDGTKIEGTNLRTFTNSNGSTIILGDGIKFSFPPGTKITSAMARRLAEIEGGDKSNKEAYVAKMLDTVTGFARKQGLDPDAAGTKKKSSSKKSSEKKDETPSESSASTTKKMSDSEEKWQRGTSPYKDGDTKKATAEEIKEGRYQDYVEKRKKSNPAYYANVKHSETMDLGSVLVSELFRGGN